MKAFASALIVGMAVAALAAAAPDTRAASQADAPKLAPREAGARHGQAMGVALVCYGLRPTRAGQRMGDTFSRADRALFDAESNKILSQWQELDTCRTAGGPNPCRLIHEWSCRDALLEIGPNGTKLPGLVEQKTELAQ